MRSGSPWDSLRRGTPGKPFGARRLLHAQFGEQKAVGRGKRELEMQAGVAPAAKGARRCRGPGPLSGMMGAARTTVAVFFEHIDNFWLLKYNSGGFAWPGGSHGTAEGRSGGRITGEGEEAPATEPGRAPVLLPFSRGAEWAHAVMLRRVSAWARGMAAERAKEQKA